uniref:Uncharacterized protein n=1 Tax=Anguilla anguilla TaxID=7936 RepID=A0A0E9SDK4_ANGAN
MWSARTWPGYRQARGRVN